MANPGTMIIVAAGSITFVNEWYQTNQINWKVPIATFLAAAVIDGISNFAPHAGVGLAIMALLGAVLTRFNGRSIFDTAATAVTSAKERKQSTKVA